MTDPIMDFFDDPNIFGGGLDGLVQDDSGFNHGTVSLDDELALGPSLVVDAGSRSSIVQHGIPYSQPVGHFDTMKAQSSIEQSFSGSEGDSNDARTFLAQQQFQGHSLNQVPQTNGLFLHNSPMWGNHDQKGNNYHQHHQPHQQLHHQQLQHKQFQQQQQQFQQHQVQHQQYSHQHLQQRQHSLNQHPVTNQLQLPHQQIGHQSLHHIGKAYQDRFYFEDNILQNNSQQSHHNSLRIEGSSFHPTVAPGGHSQSKQYIQSSMMPVASQQHSGFQVTQRIQGFTTGPRMEDNDLAFPVQSSSATGSFQGDLVTHASSYPTACYALTSQPPPIVNVTQSYSSALVSRTTSSTTIPSSASNLLDTGCPFLSTSGLEHSQQVQILGSPAQQCPLRSSKSDQNLFSSSEVFPDGLSSFPADTSFSMTKQRTCNVTLVTNHSLNSSNAFHALEEALLGEQHDQRLDDLGESPDLLGDELLPQLEAFDQEESSNHSWVNSEVRNSREDKVKEEERMEDVPLVYNAQVREAVLRS